MEKSADRKLTQGISLLKKKHTQKTPVSNNVLLVKLEPVTDTIPSSLTCWIIRASLNPLEITIHQPMGI